VLLLLLSMTARNAPAAADAGNVQVQGQRPQLAFAFDSDTPKLQSLFADPTLIPELKIGGQRLPCHWAAFDRNSCRSFRF